MHERGHDIVESLDVLTVSVLTRLEVRGALWRKHRAGELPEALAGRLMRTLDADLFGDSVGRQRFSVAALTPVVLDRAADLIAPHGLVAGDAIQLASALAARHADPECRTFACFDRRLRQAAAAHGFSLVP